METPDFDAAVERLHQRENDPFTIEAIHYLSEASHHSATDRERLASPEILKALLKLLDASVSHLEGPTQNAEPLLRCIGNAIISSDLGRGVITQYGFSWAKQCLRAPGKRLLLKTRVFNALHNICFNYSPAQKCCYEEYVHEDLLYSWLYMNQQDPTAAEQAERYGDLLQSICEHREAGREPSEGAFRSLLLEFPLSLRRKQDSYTELRSSAEAQDGGATGSQPGRGEQDLSLDASVDTDALATAVELALTYLRDGVEQGKFVEESLVGKVWQILVEIEEKISSLPAAGEEEDVKLLIALSMSLTWCLSDMAATEEFAVHYSDRSEFIHNDIFNAIRTAKSTRLVSAACQVFGNLLWSVKDKDPSTYNIDVLNTDLHQGLVRVATSASEAETLYSIAGLLIHLCRHSEEYRARLCDDEHFGAILSTLCESDSKEVRQGGMKLLQLLGKNNAGIREDYAGLAKQVMESLVAEHNSGQGGALQQQNGSIVELPD